jgi:crossover junction endodeoxyribonuclease RuvC
VQSAGGEEKEEVSHALKILGIDPGLANMGVALFLLDPDQGYYLEDVVLITTKKDSKKRGLRQKADDVRRLQKVIAQFREIVLKWHPDVCSFEEAPTLRNSMAVRKVALSWGACYAVANERPGTMTLEYGPQDLKVVVTGSKSASKAEIIETLSTRFPALAESTIPQSKKEHVADAVAAALKAAQDPAVVALANAKKRVTS